MLFEKPALDGKKLASEKGNNLILSNLAEGGNIVIPSMHMCMCLHLAVGLCKFVYLCVRRTVHMHLLVSKTEVCMILIFGPS